MITLLFPDKICILVQAGLWGIHASRRFSAIISDRGITTGSHSIINVIY